MAASFRKAVVGLGNPGPQYERTRHNLGFLAIDHYLERVRRAPEPLPDEHALLYRVGRDLLAKPQTYMNLSGLAVREISKRFRLAPQQFFIVYDDVALPFGTLRARARGGAGGHRGMASVIEALGTEEVPRLRLGIGRDPVPEDLTSYVLEEFTPEEEERLDAFLDRAAEAIGCFLYRDILAVMNEFNR
jgi:PTH1 family peptidyl-tRNA hydrolase